MYNKKRDGRRDDRKYHDLIQHVEVSDIGTAQRTEVKKNIHLQLMKLHRATGHRNNQTLVGLLRNDGACKEVLELAAKLKCDACEEQATPGLQMMLSSVSHIPGRVCVSGLLFIGASR